MRLLSKGRRGIVYVDQHKGVEIAVKVAKPRSNAFRMLQSEAYWLEKANEKGIGPKFIGLNEKGLLMEFIRGEEFRKWHLNYKGTKAYRDVLKDVLKQCRILDIIGLQKEEMHHPLKHIILTKKSKKWRATLIDFERSRSSLRPSNVTQFCQFLRSLNEKHCSNWKEVLINYKNNPDSKNFEKVLKCFYF